MFRKIDFLLVCLVLVVATATYVVKYGSEIEYNNISKLEREIETEKEAIDILKANWSLLTDPARIQKLSEQHGDELGLETLKSNQMITLDQIPLKPAQNPDVRSADINPNKISDQTSGEDIITGSIKVEGGNQ